MKKPFILPALLALAMAGPLCADAVTADAAAPAIAPASGPALDALSSQVDKLQAAADSAITWNVNLDLRFDYAPYKLTTSEQAGNAGQHLVHYGLSTTAGAGALANDAANGYVGGYFRRVEVEATGKLSSWAVWNAQIDLASLKLEDTGMYAKGLSLLPYVKVPGYEWDVKAGLYRQPFGIENQTGSKDLLFPERAIMDGGYSPAAFASSTPVKLVYERILGVQFIQAHSYGAFGYKIQAAVGDDQKDQDAGSSAILGAFAGASPAPNTYTAATASAPSLGLTTDQDPSEFARIGFDLNFVPSIVTLNLGASAIHNPSDTALLATSGTAESWQDTYGFDGTLGIPAAQTTIQAEWVAQNSFANDASSYAPKGVAGQFKNRGEGWYVQSTTKPLAFFSKDLSNLDLNLRIEDITPNVNVGTAASRYLATSEQANTIGLKYSYKGKTYTSVNYSNYALNGNYTAIAGSSLFSVQQQFNY